MLKFIDFAQFSIKSVDFGLQEVVAAFQAGAFEYLPKPFDLMQAVALVQRAAQGRAEAARGAASARPSLFMV